MKAALHIIALLAVVACAQPTTVVKELLNNQQLVRCYEKKYCVLAFLPHVMDSGAAGRNEFIGIMSRLQATVPVVEMEFHWLGGGIQTTLEEALFVKAGYPTVVVVDKTRMRYYPHVGKFEEKALAKSLKSVQNGRVGLLVIKSLPSSIFTTLGWDGEEYKEASDEI